MKSLKKEATFKLHSFPSLLSFFFKKKNGKKNKNQCYDGYEDYKSVFEDRIFVIQYILLHCLEGHEIFLYFAFISSQQNQNHPLKNKQKIAQPLQILQPNSSMILNRDQSMQFYLLDLSIEISELEDHQPKLKTNKQKFSRDFPEISIMLGSLLSM